MPAKYMPKFMPMFVQVKTPINLKKESPVPEQKAVDLQESEDSCSLEHLQVCVLVLRHVNAAGTSKNFWWQV